MIDLTEHLFNDEILNKTLAHFKIDKSSVIKHEGFCSYVFEGKRDDQDVILKLSHSSRVSKESLQSELDFTHHLKEHKIKICTPLTSSIDIFEIKDAEGGSFYSYLYEKVAGSWLCDKENKSAQDYKEAGRILGELHNASLTFDYKSHNSRASFLDRDFVNYKEIIPKKEIHAHKCFDELVSKLKQIPKNEHNYGMTHGDAHDGNFLAHEGNITLIDFDDIEPGFFISDIAVFLDNSCIFEKEEDRTFESVDYIFSNLINGYKEKRETDLEMIKLIPLFIKFRWVMNHCLTQMIHGDDLLKDERRATFHKKRTQMFKDDFKYYDFVNKFDYVKSYKNN